MPNDSDGSVNGIENPNANPHLIFPAHVPEAPRNASNEPVTPENHRKPPKPTEPKKEEMFGLYEKDDEKNDEKASDEENGFGKPDFNLRCVSLPHAGFHAPSTEKHSVTAPNNLQQSGATTDQLIDTSRRLSMDEGNASKKVTDYYKKQNELLENFKNDSEQIEAFKKTRTRQRLNSSISEFDKEKLKQADEQNEQKEDPEPVQPVEKEVPVTKDETIACPEDVPTDLKFENCEKQALISAPETDRRSLSGVSRDSLMARHEAQLKSEERASKAALRLTRITLFVNFLLMVAKVTASVLSGSMSIISSMVDSVVDLTSGLVLSVSTRMIRKRDPYLYPRGRTRLEPLSLILISVIMGMASIQLIINSGRRIHEAFVFDTTGDGQKPKLDVTWVSVAIMAVTIVVKIVLYIICQKYKKDASIAVLALDHRNDCISNTVALTCAWLGTSLSYYMDPVGAILVSLYILYTWVNTGKEYITKLSGKSAEPEFINRIIKVCIDHDPRISHLETVYVYHYGTKFLVEVHIVLDEKMYLRDAHDISEALQINIESLPEVERAFVHTDYEFNHHPEDEHKLV
ncbi:unnamed protein product [Caenorhabditis auriculariae]|uniref:Cation efflux protein cytoplasmic domain-containing protein n=1 Tax=Caenorhabditis auriculariae TaxID=2777116 RepID=A0A8S1H525_9PELO|nr:unnamed protein product [Caenorhabditis auriculariae]